MAKSKRDDDELDDDIDDEEPDVAAADDDDVAEADVADTDSDDADVADVADADDDDAAGDLADKDLDDDDAADVADKDADDDDAAGVADKDADDDEPDAPAKPVRKAKVTALTLVLCGLNVFAALGFMFLLMLNYEKRQGYAFAAAANEFFLVGPGTKEDKDGVTAGTETMPRPKLSAEMLKEAFRTRPGVSSVSEAFAGNEDPLRFQLYAGELTPEILREWMKDVGDPVGSIEEEMNRLKTKLVPDIQAAAQQVTESLQKATDNAKQTKMGMLLYPLCQNPMQVRALEKKIAATQGAALDKALEEAVERRVLFDILMPVELYRAGEAEQKVLEKAADLDAVKIEDIRDLLNRRLDAAAKETHDGSVFFGEDWNGKKRGTIEKRQNAAFLLISVAYARKNHDKAAKLEDQYLYTNGLERAQRISGLYNFTAACKAYHDAVRNLEERVIAAIALDRDGFSHEVNKETKRSEGFADKHAALQNRIRLTQLQIRQSEERIKDLTEQRKRALKLVDERTSQKAELDKRIVEERAVTKTRAAELRELQDQLFRALAELASAAENNADLLDRIGRLSGLKGTEP